MPRAEALKALEDAAREYCESRNSLGRLDSAKLHAIEDALAQLDSLPPDDQSRWRHKKRGTTYRVIGRAALQTSEPMSEGDLLVVYRADVDGMLWARPSLEFHDGRFEELPPAPSPETKGQR